MVRINDNSKATREELSQAKNTVERISNKTLKRLQEEGVFVFPEIVRDTEDLSHNQMVMWEEDGKYATGNVVGFIGDDNERLIIGSRFGSKENDYFFQYLLEKLFFMPIITDLVSDSDQSDAVFDLLPFIFPYYLRKAIRKGLYKEYVRYNYNDSHVKGTVNISRHIKENIPFTGKIAYGTREMSTDNPLMELVRHTIEHLKRKPYWGALYRSIREETKIIVEATPAYRIQDKSRVISINRNTPVRHAYYGEYLALQRLCLLILQYRQTQVGTGNRPIHGVLFDCAWLWEEYINKLIATDFYHPRNKGGGGGQRLFDKNQGLIYPDFIGKDKNNRAIADAKYKPVANIGNRDYLQVLAYMYRFKAKRGFYLYPEASDENGVYELIMQLNQGTTYEKDVTAREDVWVKKLGLRIPEKAKSYSEFKSKMTENEKKFASTIMGDTISDA